MNSDGAHEDPKLPAVSVAEARARSVSAVVQIGQDLGDAALCGKANAVVVVTTNETDFSVVFGGATDSIRTIGMLQMALQQMLKMASLGGQGQ